jgi:hypothetical protein
MKFSQGLFTVTAIGSYLVTATALDRSSHVLLAQPVTIEPKYKVEILKTIKDLQIIQSELEAKITMCNGGKILTRFCPRPPQPTIEPTGAGSLVRALKQTKQTIATLELYLDPTLDRNNLK